MKYKIYTYVLILLIFQLLYTSCSEDFLNQSPVGTIKENEFYRTVEELDAGLVACYGYLRSNGYLEMGHWIMGDIGSDDADCGSNSGDQPLLYDISYSRQTPSNWWIYGFWVDYYRTIGRCNQVIDRSPGVQGAAVEVEKITDQARFLRAFCYYFLVTAFGDIPVVQRFMEPDELKLLRAPVNEIWALIESDLIQATNLPFAGEWDQSGRVTSGAVYSLLGKVYLTQKKYALANSAFYNVVNSSQYHLVPDFGYIFRYEGENCAESIFEIQHKNNVAGGNMGTSSGPYRLPRDNAAGGWGFDCPTADLLSEFEPGDPRIIYTFLFPGDVLPAPGNTTYTVENFESPTGYNSRKAWIPFSERRKFDYESWDINYRYMRYAEILLLYAESLNEVNKPDSSLLLLNKVRARARNTPVIDPQRISCAFDLSYTGELLPDITTTNKEELQKAIWHEQRVELAIEGHRRNMLLRTGRFIERMEIAKDFAGCKVEPHELLLPIPQSEIELSNGILTQNPGYQ